MRRAGWTALAASTLALSACGSKGKTASVGSTSAPPPAAQSTAVTRSTAQTTPPPAPTGATEASTTRTATEPAFTSQPSTPEGASAAVATLRARGFVPVSTADYHPSQTLRVIIGARGGTSAGNPHSAFFFIDGHYIGTDASTPSSMLRVASQSDTEVTLAYGLRGGGEAHVRFQLNNGKLVALDPIPALSSRR